MWMGKDLRDFEKYWDESDAVTPAMSALESTGTCKFDELSEEDGKEVAIAKMANAVAFEMLRAYHDWANS